MGEYIDPTGIGVWTNQLWLYIPVAVIGFIALFDTSPGNDDDDSDSGSGGLMQPIQ